MLLPVKIATINGKLTAHIHISLYESSTLQEYDAVLLFLSVIPRGEDFTFISSYILIPSLDPFLEEHVPFGKGLTPAICSRMAVFVSRHERVTLITFLFPYDSNLMRNEFLVESMSWPTSLT